MDARLELGSGCVAGKERGLTERHGGLGRRTRRRRSPSGWLLTIAIIVLALTLPATSSLGLGGSGTSVFETGIDDFRITRFGTDGSTTFNVYAPEMAYNSRNNEYLVVWEGDKGPADDHYEIWGRRIDAATGDLIGTDSFQISDMLYDADSPDVVYNSTNNEYLVVWQGGDTSGDIDVWGQRLNAATGAEVGTHNFRISAMGGYGTSPAVAYNSQDNQALVVWQGNTTTSGEREIYGQLLDAATGAQIGPTDSLLSQMGTSTNTSILPKWPDVAYNSTDNNYLAVWESDSDILPLKDNEYEIYGQLVSAAGAEIGTDDIRLSDMGADGSNDATEVAVTYNSGHNEYLVVWQGFDDSPPAPPEASGFEIWGQRVVGSTGAEVGTNDFNISDTGATGGWSRYATYAEVGYDPIYDQYLVVWRADDDASSCADGEYEMHGQFLDGATGADILLNDFRFSTMGTDGAINLLVPMQSTLAYGGAENGWLVVWRSDNDDGSLVYGEWELYGQFLTSNFLDFMIVDAPQLPSPRSLLSPPGQ